jgi:hypothetical protein
MRRSSFQSMNHIYDLILKAWPERSESWVISGLL